MHSLLCIAVAFTLVQADPELHCNSESIYVTITDRFFATNNIDITDEGQLHFYEHPDCSAERIDDGYVLSTYTPYTDCGTRVEHNGDKYVFRNEIVFSTPNSYRAIMSLECHYDDKYVVSSPFGITPHVRTLNFATARGTLSVGMNLYQRSDFHPKSKFGPRPSVVVGVPIYASVDMDDVFGDDSIVTSLESCYATTSQSLEVMNNYHFLITGRCASPSDGTVRIFSNGEGTKARFSFQMFQWKKNKEEYIYLHCEVYVCNRTAEICAGSGPLCNNNNGVTTSGRKKRNANAGPTGFLTYGPIAMATVTGKGQANLKIDIDSIKQDQELLTNCILGGVFGILFIITVIFAVVIIVKRRRRRNKQVLSEESVSSVESLDKRSSLPQT